MSTIDQNLEDIVRSEYGLQVLDYIEDSATDPDSSLGEVFERYERSSPIEALYKKYEREAE